VLGGGLAEAEQIGGYLRAGRRVMDTFRDGGLAVDQLDAAGVETTTAPLMKWAKG
jgi:hypothetical protein